MAASQRASRLNGKRTGRPKGKKTTNPKARKTVGLPPVTREEIKAKAASLQRKGYSQEKIVAKLAEEGIEVSQPTISNLLAEVREAYKKTALIDKSEHINERLGAMSEVRLEMWEAWEKSKAEIARKTTETLDNGEGGYTKEQLIEEQRLAFKAMDLIMETWRDETELLGYKPQPKPAETNVNVINLDWSNAATMPAPPDPLAAKIGGINLLPNSQLAPAPSQAVPISTTFDEIVPPTENNDSI